MKKKKRDFELREAKKPTRVKQNVATMNLNKIGCILGKSTPNGLKLGPRAQGHIRLFSQWKNIRI